MKNLILLFGIAFLLASCSSATDMKVHEHKEGDTYCTYSAVGAGPGSFDVCVFCPAGAAICGTLKEVRVLREHHWILPNEYDYFTLTSTGRSCNTCTGLLYWEKE
ncbi:MAG: hypothetical protein R2764_04800 [Bacteroidales bacterium]